MHTFFTTNNVRPLEALVLGRTDSCFGLILMMLYPVCPKLLRDPKRLRPSSFRPKKSMHVNMLQEVHHTVTKDVSATDRNVAIETKKEKMKKTILQTDNGSEFKNKVMTELVRLRRGKRVYSRAYNPRTNGKVENRVRQVAKNLRADLGERDLEAVVSEGDLESRLQSVVATMNYVKTSTTSCRPWEVRVVQLQFSSLRFIYAAILLRPRASFHPRF